MKNPVENVGGILLKQLMSHDHLFGHHCNWKQKLLIWSKY